MEEEEVFAIASALVDHRAKLFTKGDQGEQGEPGQDGLDGKDGKDGEDGKDGPAGPKGDQGPAGKDGKDGKDGKVGPKGPKGAKGDKGDTGPRGRAGADGGWLAAPQGGGGGEHPDLATHDALGLATDAEVATAISDHEAAANPHPTYETSAEVDAKIATHAGEADPHTGYRLESADHSHASSGAQGGQIDHGALLGLADDDHPQYATNTEFDDHSARHEDGGADEISLTGLAGTPAALTTHEAAADPHTGYVKENDANWTDLTDGGATTLHSHAGGGDFTMVVKASTDTVTNSATMTSDSELFFAVDAASTYSVEFCIDYSSNTEDRYNWRFLLPTLTYESQIVGHWVGTTTGALIRTDAYIGDGTKTLWPPAAIQVASDANHAHHLVFFGQFLVRTNGSGTIYYQCSNASAGGGVESKTYPGSFIRYRKLA